MMQALNFNCVWWVSIFPTMHTWLLNNNQQKNKLFFGTNLIILVKTGKFLYRTFWSQIMPICIINCWTRTKKRVSRALISYDDDDYSLKKCRLLLLTILLPEIMRYDQRNTPVKSTKYFLWFIYIYKSEFDVVWKDLEF